ncbi:conserved hypothetical protein [Vibrio chagasii]|nr:conserved hypothetical protein [Vibrio chagasii]
MKEVEMFNNLNCPAMISVRMDYDASPIWVAMQEGQKPDECIELSLLPFSDELKHVLACYRDLWESCHSSEYVATNEIGDLRKEYPNAERAMDSSLAIIKSTANQMLSAWMQENNWSTELV